MTRRAAIAAAMATAIEQRQDLDCEDLRHVKIDVRFNPRNGAIAGVRVEVITDKEAPGRTDRSRGETPERR